MPGLAKLIMIIEGVGLVIAAVLLVYLVFRRIEIRKKENFENRDN